MCTSCSLFQRILSLETLRERNNQQLLVKEQELETMRQQLTARGGEVCTHGTSLQKYMVPFTVDQYSYIHLLALCCTETLIWTPWGSSCLPRVRRYTYSWEYSSTCEDLLHFWHYIGGILNVLLAADDCQKGEQNHTRSCHKNSWVGGGFYPIFDSSWAKWSLDSQQKLHTNTWCVFCSLDIYKPTIFHWVCVCVSIHALWLFMTLLEKLMLSIEVVAYPREISFLLLQKSFF